MATSAIDLNADVGESFGARRLGDDEPLFAYVSSANVACGFHAGTPAVIAATIEAAMAHQVAVGAHPSYPDPAGFGRKTMHLSAGELRSVILYQLGAVEGIARSYGIKLSHVKPHGALYNDAATNAALAQSIAAAVASFDRNLILVGLAGSALLSAGKNAGLRVAAEAFCDRTYEDNGLLRSRAHADAILHEEAEVVRQAVEIATMQRVQSVSGRTLPLQAQTLCVHGDNPEAVRFAKAVREALSEAGVAVRSLTNDAG